MHADLRPFLQPFHAFVGLYLTAWTRSRAPWLWLVFVAAWAWLDWELPAPGTAWWARWASLMAMTGFLAGYDAYLRPREDGSLRLLLLHGASRPGMTAAFLAGGGLLTGCALLVFAGYLLVAGRTAPGPEVLVIFMLLWASSLGFVAYAQLGSLLLPRDTAAVLGLLIIFFGFGPPDAWIPPGAPGAARFLARAATLLFPTTHRVEAALEDPGARTLPLLLALVQIVAATCAIHRVLGSRRLLSRSRGE